MNEDTAPHAQEPDDSAPAAAPSAGDSERVDPSPSPAANEEGEGLPAPDEPTRREVLAKAALGLSACAFAGAGAVVGVSVVGTPLAAKPEKGQWCPLGPAESFADGPRKLPIRAPGRDAWRRFSSRSLGRVVVVKEGDEISVFSAACPHNGCDVTVSEDESEFLCPCHHSRFSLDGERIEGQSPRGLDPLQTRVNEGELEVQWQRFALGTPDRKPS